MAEQQSARLFPVGDQVHELGYTNMFDAMDEKRQPRETFYDGYAVCDACYRSVKSRKWESVELEDGGGKSMPCQFRGFMKRWTAWNSLNVST